jgi:UPF0755 protein
MFKLGSKTIAVLGVIFIAAILAVFFIVKPFFSSVIRSGKENPYTLYIPTGSGFEDVVDILKKDTVLLHENAFRKVAGLMSYDKDEVPSGRYILHSGLNAREVVGKLRSGNQDAVNVVINNVRTLADLSGKLSQYLEADSLAILSYLTNTDVLRDYGLTAETMITLFIPNTYQLFWNTKPEKLLQRMKKEHDRFWTQDKLDKIRKLGISPVEAYTLASIVEKESNYAPERPAIAGVYLNRIKQGMKLQADPTVVFATGQYDLKRVLYTHLETDSPYNTYKYPGIPPGPIYMPSISSLEAVINAENHDYIFFCAKPDNSGQHVFAATLDEHDKNARLFSEWLNKIGIK